MENGKLKIKNEVLIDGVDVSGCCYYEPKNDTGEWCDLTCTRDNATVFRCEKMPNCQYKRLKRLEQFLKEIEKEITTYRLKYDTTHTASKLLDSLASKIRKELYE